MQRLQILVIVIIVWTVLETIYIFQKCVTTGYFDYKEIFFNYSTKNYTGKIFDQYDIPVLNKKGIENVPEDQPRILFFLNEEEAKAQKNWLKRKADPQKSCKDKNNESPFIESQVDFMEKISTIVKLSSQEINEELEKRKGLPDESYLDAIVEILEKNPGYSPTTNGEWIPENCETDKLLVLVPYRDRSENILYFLYYMHLFLQSTRQHYQIVLAEQLGSGRFRRANLFNSVVYELFFGTTKEKAVCLALHDIDKVPFSPMLNYTCGEKPLQICRELINADGIIVEKYYEGFFGGVTLVNRWNYFQLNGMSNAFEGWGGEDDDFHARTRLTGELLKITHF
ncbi:hypothetical protein Ciccas_013106 [Cichlidogyrus casuarinus]|uniref:Beta-1,4-galactosyltransferase n=1 Tax=Cichlidogyrus casuarinus TaxID=1844966 RepID=A0ABD2PM81_9PLAT